MTDELETSDRSAVPVHVRRGRSPSLTALGAAQSLLMLVLAPGWFLLFGFSAGCGGLGGCGIQGPALVVVGVLLLANLVSGVQLCFAGGVDVEESVRHRSTLVAIAVFLGLVIAVAVLMSSP